MTKKELIAKFEEMKKEHDLLMFVALEECDDKAASYFQGFTFGMEVAIKFLERSSLK